MPHNSGIDNCGVCMGGNKCVGCDLVPYSKKRRDKCGNCLNEEDENWNSKYIILYIINIKYGTLRILYGRENNQFFILLKNIGLIEYFYQLIIST